MPQQGPASRSPSIARRAKHIHDAVVAVVVRPAAALPGHGLAAGVGGGAWGAAAGGVGWTVSGKKVKPGRLSFGWLRFRHLRKRRRMESDAPSSNGQHQVHVL
ncbi:hypothetical protein B0H34DRAFT_673592 [Crassisporium funariophilum]|nr:hypothetical protein B0H34DRAFT_673592 [Crassisporium funariophilum]